MLRGLAFWGRSSSQVTSGRDEQGQRLRGAGVLPTVGAQAALSWARASPVTPHRGWKNRRAREQSCWAEGTAG